MKNRRGFTLIELLAVIVVLAIIFAIAVPVVLRVIGTVREGAFESNAKMIIKAVNLERTRNLQFAPNTVNAENLKSTLGIEGARYDYVSVSLINDEVTVYIVGKDSWEDLVACGTEKNLLVGEGDSCSHLVYDFAKGVNRPQLAEGMTPVVWNGSAWEATTAEDEEWYDYSTQKWANAQTDDGSFWVWIPRYTYKITSGWHTSTAGTIEVAFSMGNDDTRNGVLDINRATSADASNAALNGNKFTDHPAFTFGETEINGFWMAKFKASPAVGTPCYTTPNETNCNVTSTLPKFVPGQFAWSRINNGNIFETVFNMKNSPAYGWDEDEKVDTHMTKNIEWGAVTYLAHSAYGKNGQEIWINQAGNLNTGCAGDSVSAAHTAGCLRTYDTTNGQQASTTGTIYGVYDMTGPIGERMAAYLNNGDENLNTYGLQMANADSKYKDIYLTSDTDEWGTNFIYSAFSKGDAMFETSATNGNPWFNDYYPYPSEGNLFFGRGGVYFLEQGSGPYARYAAYGHADNMAGFRAVVIVSEDL